MKSYYLKYVMLFLFSVLLIDIVIFVTSEHQKDVDISSLTMLGHAIEVPIDKGDITKVNNIIDSYSDKIIIEREGVVYTSNFAKDHQDRTELANEQLQKYRDFWKPLTISNSNTAETIYYKVPEINYFNKIIIDTLFSFLLAFCTLPLLFLAIKDIDSLYDSIEHLKQYLISTREQLDDIKHNKIYDDFDKSKEKERLHKKLVDSKAKRIGLQKEVENLQKDLEKKVNDIVSLKENISSLKSDIQNNKIDKNRLDEAKNIAIKEKKEINKKLSQLEEIVSDKNIEIERDKVKIRELNDVMNQINEHLKIREKEIEKLKNSKIDPREFESLKEQMMTIQSESFAKDSDIKDLLSKMSQKDDNIVTLKENLSQLTLDRVRFQNELSNLRTKNHNDKDVIEALVNESNLLKDKINAMNEEMKSMNQEMPVIKSGAYLDAEYNRLNILLKDKDSQLQGLVKENKQKETELKEFTLDTLNKLSALKRFEAQILDISREIKQKDSIIESANARLDVKDKIINTLNKELNDVKDKLNKVSSTVLSDV